MVIGAPFASGILATGGVEGAYYRYQPATSEIMQRVAGMETICARYDVPLPAAALQFPFGHPAVASVIPGSNSPEQFRQINTWMRVDIPADLWADRSLMWYATTVKLHLEAEGMILVSGSPQKLTLP